MSRVEPPAAEAITALREEGALPVVAHPFRLAEGNLQREREMIAAFCRVGLEGIEIGHSNHSPAGVARFLALARQFDLAVTGGSDFHGEAKPGVRLGAGRDGNLAVPRAVPDRMRERAARL